MEAFYRFEVKPISRQPGSSAVGSAAYRSGKNAVSAAAYRNGGKLVDEKTGQSFDYSAKIGVWGAEIIAPSHAPAWMQDRAKLWNAVEEIETRKNSLLAKDHIISLPYQLNRAQGEAAIREFVKERFVSQGMVADVAFHKYGTPYKAWAKNTADQVATWQAAGVPFYEKTNEPDSADNSFILVLRNKKGGVREYVEYQPHAHVMMPMRLVEKDGFAAHKIRAPKGQHTQAWEKQQLRVTRKEWEIVCNRHLELAGSEARVDCRKNEERGVDRIAQPKVGQLATKKERAGEPTLAGEDRRNVVALNVEQAQLKTQRAQLAAEEAEIINLMSARIRKQAMNGDASEKAAAQQAERIAKLAFELKAEEERARALLRREAEAVVQRAEALKTETQRAAEKAARDLEERTRTEERRAHEGKIASAESRYAIALGETYDVRDPYGSLARAAGSEYAMFHRRQNELGKELAEAKTPEQRREITLRREIEQHEYMGLTSHRIAGLNEAIGGEGHKRSAILEHERGDAFDRRANDLRQERADLLESVKLHGAGMAADPGAQAKDVERGAARQDGLPAQAKGQVRADSSQTTGLPVGSRGITAESTRPVEASQPAQGRPREDKEAAERRTPQAGGKDYSNLSEKQRTALEAMDRDFAASDQRRAAAKETGRAGGGGRGR